MRVLVVPCIALLLMTSAVAAEPWEAEVRVGYGVSMGSGGAGTARTTPLTVTAIGATAIVEEPAVSAFGGLVVETLDRSAAGATAGVRISPRKSRLRLAAGGTWIFAPYTLWGATASGGACRRVAGGIGLCGDLQISAYFAGTDLAPGTSVTQVQAVIGMVFDVL